jgi:molybdenum cofactor cytidylyltransferase
VRTVAIVLAAGSSTRLGTPKQDLLFRGETLLQRASRIAHAVADETIVITLENNPNADEGIASSIHAGVERAGDARILITLCDQPFVSVEHLRALLAIDAPIVASGYRGIAGVPAAFAPRFIPELLALRGDRGARAVIEAHRDETVVVPFEEAGTDIDTPEDLGRLL